MAEKSLITNHPVNNTLRNILRLFDDQGFIKKVDALNSEPRATVRSIELFSRQTSKFLENSSDFEVSFNGLRQFQNNLQNVWNELNTFRSNGNEVHVTNAASNLDGALNSASWAFFNRPPKGSKTYGEIIDSVRNAARTSIAEISKRAESAANEIEAFKARLDEIAAKVDQSEKRLSEIGNRADAHLSGISSDFASIKAQIEEERQQDRNKREQDFLEFSNNQKEEARRLLKKIEEHEEQARKIVQIVGNIGITGNFQKRSSDERSQANLWRNITISIFFIGVLLVAISLYSNIYSGLDLETLLTRVAIGITITLPAIYTARESARHRTNSDRAKQVELELASLAPFIERLPDEDKWKILTGLSQVYFGGDRVEAHRVEFPFSPDKLFNTLDKFADRIPKV